MTQPRLPGTLTAPGCLTGVSQANILKSLTDTDGKAWHELWSKLRWALGTSYETSYTKSSPAGMVARLMALRMVETNGIPAKSL